MEIGTLALTENSAVVTGTGTAFTTTLAPQYALLIGGLPHLIKSIESGTSLTLTQAWDGETTSGVEFEKIVTANHIAELHENVEDLLRSFGPLRVGADDYNALISRVVPEAQAARDGAVTANADVQAAKTIVDNKAADAVAAKVEAESARDISIQKNAQTVTLASQVDTSAKAVKASETTVVGLEASTRASKLASDASAAQAKTSEINSGAFAADARADKLATDQNVATTTADRQAVADMKAGVDQAKTETVTARDTTVTNRQTVETLAARVGQDKQATAEYVAAAEAAADRADNFDPSSLARLDGADFTGPVSVSGAPVWHSGNFNPSNYATAANASIQNVATISGNAPRITFNETDVGKVWYGVADGSNFSIREDTTSSANIKFNITAGAKALNLGATSMTWGGSVVHTADNFDPAAKANLSGATFTGPISVASDLTVRAQNADLEGGQIVLKKAANQSIDGDIVIDTQGASFRVFDNVTTGRMLNWNAVAGTLSVNGQTVYHTGNNPTKAAVGLGDVDNTSDTAKPISTATQNALNGKQSALGYTPVQQGTGTGQGSNVVKIGWSGTRLKATVDNSDQGNFVFDAQMTKANVGLGNVDNTSDANKPVSTATQNALNAKASLTGATFSGAVAISSAAETNRLVQFQTSGAQRWAIGADTTVETASNGGSDFAIHRYSQSGSWLNAPITINRATGMVYANSGLDSTNVITVRGSGGPVLNLHHTGTTGDSAINFQRNGLNRFTVGDSTGNNIFYINRNNADGSFGNTALQIRATDGRVVLGTTTIQGDLTVDAPIYTGGSNGGRNSIRIGDDVWLGDINSGNCLNIRGEQDPNQGWLTFGNSTQRFGRGSNGDYFHVEGDLKVLNWIRASGNNGLYWENHGRGIRAGGIDSGYGNIDVYGNGANGWAGYSVGTWSSYMSNGSETGLYSQARGLWHLRFDGNNDAWFPANVVAYSDERLKDNIRPIDDFAARRKGLAKAAIIYERDGRTRIGYGAQTLRKSNPEFVLEADDLPRTLSVAYAETTAVLAVDLDHQATRIDALEAENAALRDRLSNIENLILKEGK